MELFRLAVEAAPNAMLMIGRDGAIALANNGAERLFGYGREELLGRSVEILLPMAFRDAHRTKRRNFFNVPSARPMNEGRRLCAIHRSGAEICVEIGLNPVSTPMGEFVLASLTDVTDRKRIEDERRRSRENLEKSVRERTQQLEAALSEKTVLLQEVHHRVKNNLQVISSLLRMQADAVGDGPVSAALRESQHRVLSMALIHERLYAGRTIQEIDFEDYSRTLVAELVRSYGDETGRITARVRCSAIRLNIDQAIPCGLILNELVTNAMKYAYPNGVNGEVLIELDQPAADRIALTVSDRGVGLPESVSETNSRSLGLRIVGILALQLGGTLRVTRTGGTSFRVEFPLGRRRK